MSDAAPDLPRRAAVEAVGTFALVFAGCGALVANDRYGEALGAVGVALAFGLVVMAVVYAAGHLAGAHVNPAVTLAFTFGGHFPARDAAAYVAAPVGSAAAIAIGGTLALGVPLGREVSGASLNPVRSFGPALASGGWRGFSVYVVGPVIGALLGVLAYRLLRGDRPAPSMAAGAS